MSIEYVSTHAVRQPRKEENALAPTTPTVHRRTVAAATLGLRTIIDRKSKLKEVRGSLVAGLVVNTDVRWARAGDGSKGTNAFGPVTAMVLARKAAVESGTVFVLLGKPKLGEGDR